MMQGSGEQAGGSGTSSGSAGSSYRSRRGGGSSGRTGSDRCVPYSHIMLYCHVIGMTMSQNSRPDLSLTTGLTVTKVRSSTP